MKLTVRISVTIIVLAAVPSAFGQPQDAAPIDPTEAPVEQVFPCNPGDYVPSPEIDSPNVPPAIDCGDVIVPPGGIDPEIKEPLPEEGQGKILVIPPSAVKPQSLAPAPGR